MTLYNSVLQALEKIHSAGFQNVSLYTFDGDTLCISAFAMTPGLECDFGVPISLEDELCIVVTPRDSKVSDDAVLSGSECDGFKKFVQHNQWAYGKAIELRKVLLEAFSQKACHADVSQSNTEISLDEDGLATTVKHLISPTLPIYLSINSNHAIARAYSSLMKLELPKVPNVGDDILISPVDRAKKGLVQDSYRYRVTKIEYHVNIEEAPSLDEGMRQLDHPRVLVSADYLLHDD